MIIKARRLTKSVQPVQRHIDGVIAPLQPQRQSPLRSKRKLALYIASGVAVVTLIGLSLLFVRNRAPNLNNVQAVMAKVNRLYSLPTNETPALATVTDSTKLSSSFAGNVKNGDKILIYQNHKKAIVYRPNINRIVDVEPVTIDTPPSAVNAK